MSEIFLISDTHFGHHNILEFEREARPFTSIFEHDETLVENWNKIVGKNDTIFHLGDVLFGKHNFPILYRLNGRKKLILGNHDQYPSEEYLKHFTKLHSCYKFDGNIFTHIPVHESQLQHRFKLNIHGHLHSKTIPDERYFNVSCERIKLHPISYDNIRDLLK